MKVAVIPNLDKRGSSDTVERLGAFFKKNDIAAYIPDSICCSDYIQASDDEIFSVADIIITIGGDGTIIRYAKRAAEYGKPLLGINAGRMGYLADIEQNELSLISKLIKGEYKTETRMMLDVSVYENGNLMGSYSALNDAVITSGFISRIIDISVAVEKDAISYRADGLIVSTPTGSTAYSMSAGGPIIDPAVRCLTVTPVCSHSLTARPMILSENSEISIGVEKTSRTMANLSVDGEHCAEVDLDTTVILKKSNFNAKFINLTGSTIYKTVSKKF